jgi:hypothetical protein
LSEQCTVPDMPAGSASFGNCVSGSQVDSGTNCLLAASDGFECTSPGLCVDGVFEQTPSCKSTTTTVVCTIVPVSSVAPVSCVDEITI